MHKQVLPENIQSLPGIRATEGILEETFITQPEEFAMSTGLGLPVHSKLSTAELRKILTDVSRPQEEVEAARYELGARGALEAEQAPGDQLNVSTSSMSRPPAKPYANPAPSSSDNSGAVLGCIGGPILAIWAVFVLWYAPSHPCSSQVLPEKCMVYTELAATFPAAYPRVERMMAENLDIYMDRKDFDAVPFPDRKGAVMIIGKSWDPFAPWYDFASVQIRDIKTGKTLASFSCTTGSIDLKSDGWF